MGAGRAEPVMPVRSEGGRGLPGKGADVGADSRSLDRGGNRLGFAADRGRGRGEAGKMCKQPAQTGSICPRRHDIALSMA